MTILPAAESDPYSASLEGKGLPEKVELFFFYEQSCEICDELEQFYETLFEELPSEDRALYPHLIYTINTVSAEGRKTYERVTDAMGLDRLLLQAPLLIAGGRVFQGHETIADNIREAFLTAAEDIFVNQRFYNPALKKTGPRLFDDYSLNPGHVTLVYFYRIVCPYCEKASPVIDSLPKTIVSGGREVPLDIIRINTRSGNNNERVMAFFEKYQVPDDKRRVPIVFLAGGYLSGVEPITGELAGQLALQPGVNKLAELIH
jgi:thiol-disulfide isomerase/thioredoxin